MAPIILQDVQVLDNPSWYVNPVQFEIVYECSQPLPHDLEWKITYVGSAESSDYDQVLDSVLVGPVAVGSYRFVFQADPPDWTRIPQDDLLGVTVLLLTCAYNGAEFIRVGYYVNNEYADEALRDNPPATVQVDRVVRNILADKPRVTRYNIDYGVPVATVTPAISDGGLGGGGDAQMHEYSPEAMFPGPGAGQGGGFEAAAAQGMMGGAY